MKNARKLFERRKRRTRILIRKRAGGRVRLSVFRSNQHIYAQVIDDAKGQTLVCASSMEKDLRETAGSDSKAAEVVGKLVAERALAAGVKEVVFDRGGYIYHGRVKALGDAARDAGLSF